MATGSLKFISLEQAEYLELTAKELKKYRMELFFTRTGKVHPKTTQKGLIYLILSLRDDPTRSHFPLEKLLPTAWWQFLLDRGVVANLKDYEQQIEHKRRLLPLAKDARLLALAKEFSYRNRKKHELYQELTKWGEDPVQTLRYLLEYCGLSPRRKYNFYYEDGTGFIGTPVDFAPYIIKRAAYMRKHAKPDYTDSFEIDDDADQDQLGGDLYPGTYVGEVWQPGRKDSRFDDP
ncbi:MAG: hypothetical protein IPK04_15910 [Bdellovibrionales bacterium]|jgi:hypothetical protein|nr:hypothetical protein [Bdellovibrionales bacterium]